MDKHTQGEELALATEGSFLSEEEIKEMEKLPESDFPMPGEVTDPEKEHLHAMPDIDRYKVVSEEGKEL